MHTPESSPLFQAWTEPESGITSYILTERIAQIQQSFYFTNTSFSADGRHLWFYCAHPPSGTQQAGRCLGVVDLETDEVRWYAETQFFDAAPCVDPVDGTAYWCTGDAVWRRGPSAGSEVGHIADFPAELSKGRLTHRLATHLTFSADKTALSIDAQIGNDFYVGALSLEGKGFELWQAFDRCYNHAQFSPTDANLMLIAQDSWVHPITGEQFGYDNRLWLIRHGQHAQPVFDKAPRIGHEWWGADGHHVWYVDYERGTARVDIRTGASKIIWPGGRWHSHSDSRSRYLVGDHRARDRDDRPAARITCFSIESGREVVIASRSPAIDDYDTRYHTHPHPQFCLHDRYVCYTTTVLGRPDVALVPVSELAAALERAAERDPHS